jgi:HEAT repeat protein
VAQIRPKLVEDAVPHLIPFLEAREATQRGLAVWALGLLGASEARSQIECLLNDEGEIEIYRDRKIKNTRVEDLAKEALAKIGR